MNINRLFRTALMVSAMIGAASCVLTGCGKDEQAGIDPSAPDVRMKDPVYKAQLEERRQEMRRSVVKRNDIGRKMAEMVDAAKAKLKTEDMTKVNEYLAKKSKWKELVAQRAAAEAECEANRQKAMTTVRERLNQTEKISK